MAGDKHSILSLDLGSTTGWAMAENGRLIASGEVHLAAEKDSTDILRINRYRNFLIPLRGVDEIVYEKVMSHTVTVLKKNKKTGVITKVKMFSVLAAHLYGWFQGELIAFCDGNRITLTGFHHSTVKKAFTGDGHATKKDVCRRCHELGWTGGERGTAKNNNEADAIAQLYVLLAQRGVIMVF